MDSKKTLSEQPKAVKPEEVIEPKPSSRLPRLTLAIIIFILLVAGYFILSSRSKQKIINDNLLLTPTLTTDSKAKWKNYTNNDYGISFNYPSTFSEQTTSNYGRESGARRERYSIVFVQRENVGSDTDNIFVRMDVLPENQSFEEYIENVSKGEYLVDREFDIEVAGQKGIAHDSKISSTAQDLDFTAYYVPYPDQNKVLIIEKRKRDSINFDEFDQILSTFQFLE